MNYKVELEQNPLHSHESVNGTVLNCEIKVDSQESSLNDFVKQIGVVTIEEQGKLNHECDD